ncbi:hypothetical protein [Halosimplex carlsbadense]|uniref:hypothetical protein n=1 Tax=Halosimplex carlsbadense TaxID=171164 RepID=UPI0006782BC1|nr:hypothetical protein [Halosimplex carlsbadense]
MPEDSDAYRFRDRPESIDAPSRQSKFGTVVDEVGVYQNGSGKDYWKVIQRIENDDEDWETHIRVGYYAGTDGEWSWSSRPMMLQTQMLNELYAQAVSAGILTD